jgi:sodium-dependent phosphate transporter
MYLWILVVGGAFSFFAAMGIGANDAANAFATSIGSKALNMKQAVVLACIFETAGAVLMGSHVTDTIRKGIADYKCFEEQPELLMYGCMWVVLSVGMWLFLASKYEMPVSTTHSCVGGMVGMTMVLAGSDCVIWYKSVETFPYIGGVSGIVMSWFLSPIFSAIFAIIIFSLTRTFVLRKQFDSYRTNIAYPIFIGSTMTINSFFIIYKGAKGLGLDKTDIGVALGSSFGIGIGSALLTIPLIPYLKKYINNKLKNNSLSEEKSNVEMTLSNEIVGQQDRLNIKSEKELNRVVQLHEKAEKFDYKTEELFKYLQIFTAICDSFSHGANDVANAIGPFAVIYVLYDNNYDISGKKTDMGPNAYWILAMGGVGIAIGLLVYGYKITRAIGEKLCKITPSRGVAIELSSALVIIMGSRLKIPLSTTHCQVGATTGVGFLENTKDCSGINCRVFGKTVFGWLVTCVIVGATSALLTAQGVYSPAIQSWGEITNTTF